MTWRAALEENIANLTIMLRIIMKLVLGFTPGVKTDDDRAQAMLHGRPTGECTRR
jgi:hypothetical protein